MDKPFNNLRVGVLYGGISGERDVSLVSGQLAYQSLRGQGLDVVMVDINTSDPVRVKAAISASCIKAAFIALHGEFGEDGGIQAILEEMGLPYSGSGPEASYLAMDKIESKKIFMTKGVPTPDYLVWSDQARLPTVLKYPVVVKPYYSGSSLGVSIVADQFDLAPALRESFAIQDKALIEDYIEGRELTVGVFDDKPLAVVEIIARDGYYDFKHKYSDGLVDFVSPAKLSADVYRQVQEVGFAAHQALGCRHFSRVDLRLNHQGKAYVLEVNSIPGLTSHSLMPLSAKACGIEYDALIKGMLELALRDHRLMVDDRG
jgi:D-alanine-D-alanine ligase